MSKSIAQTVFAREFGPPLCRFPAEAAVFVRGEVDGDVFLRRIVDTCAAGVAVLDELGTLLYVSPAWGPLVEQDDRGESADSKNSFLGIGKSSAEGFNALAENIQRILEGREREFHKEYSVAGNDGGCGS